MPAKLRCFVAMAFDHKATDAIFKILRKTLGPVGINAQRVDRIEHNDNIDTKIISEIEAARMVIADLTYARPSVYFEAGYAPRAIPVISRPGAITSGNATTTRTATVMSTSISRCATSSLGDNDSFDVEPTFRECRLWREYQGREIGSWIPAPGIYRRSMMSGGQSQTGICPS